MNTAPRFFIRPEPYGLGYALHFVELNEDGSRSVAECVTVRRVTNGESAGPMMAFPQGEFGNATLQSLMDELWNIGVRPKDIGTAGHLAATKEHLEDMRAIAFSKLEVPKP